MNLQERQSLPELWLYSFSVALRALPKLLVVFAGYLIAGYILKKIMESIVTPVLQFFAPLFFTGSKFSLLVNVACVFLFAWTIKNLYVKFFVVLGIRLAGNTAENKTASLVENAFDSIKPAVFNVVAGLIKAIPVAILLAAAFTLFGEKIVAGYIMGNISKGTILSIAGLVGIILFFVLYIRLIYAEFLIALKGNGPIEGLVESWRMTAGIKYLDTLLLCVMLVASSVIIGFLFWLLLWGLYIIIPLYFASLFDLSNTWVGWVVLGSVLGILWFFIICQGWGFLLVTFLNRYYTNDAGNGGMQPTGPAGSNPVDGDAALDLQPVPVPETHIEGELPQAANPGSNQSPQAPAVPQQPQDPAEITGMVPLGGIAPKPAQVAVPPAAENPDNLQLSQSLVNTTEETVSEIDQHLDKVYTPSADAVIQHGDEDRMPTILFDDEMAKQLESTAKQFSDHQKKKEEGPQDPGTIKMSK